MQGEQGVTPTSRPASAGQGTFKTYSEMSLKSERRRQAGGQASSSLTVLPGGGNGMENGDFSSTLLLTVA